MENPRWAIRFAGAGVWVLASLTWGSIAHHLLGLPDLGSVMAIVAVTLVLALPAVGAARSRRPMTRRAFVEEVRQSRP